MRRLAALLLLSALSLPAFADTPIQTVPAATGYKSKSITVSTGANGIPVDEFITAIMSCKNYPMTASYMGVKALEECSDLEKRSDGSTVIYQRTGGALGISSRQYVLRLYVASKTDTAVEIKWDLVKHDVSGETYSGPFASTLNKYADDAVYTPYNKGGWKLDNVAHTISYYVSTDPGGSLPDWMQTDGAIMAFPKELMKTRWGIEQ